MSIDGQQPHIVAGCCFLFAHFLSPNKKPSLLEGGWAVLLNLRHRTWANESTLRPGLLDELQRITGAEDTVIIHRLVADHGEHGRGDIEHVAEATAHIPHCQGLAFAQIDGLIVGAALDLHRRNGGDHGRFWRGRHCGRFCWVCHVTFLC